MQVKCNDDSGFEDQLTAGSTYTVHEIEGGSVLLTNDCGLHRWYGLDKFAIVDS